MRRYAARPPLSLGYAQILIDVAVIVIIQAENDLDHIPEIVCGHEALRVRCYGEGQG